MFWCSTGHFGPHCEHTCNANRRNHEECDENGNKICNEGITLIFTNIRMSAADFIVANKKSQKLLIVTLKENVLTSKTYSLKSCVQIKQ